MDVMNSDSAIFDLERSHSRKRRRISACDDSAIVCHLPLSDDKNSEDIEGQDIISVVSPLTRENLRRHQQAMDEDNGNGKRQPQTPRKSAGDALSTLETPSRSSKTSNSVDIVSIMELYSIFGPNASRNIFLADKDFYAEVTTLVQGTRKSAMKGSSVERFREKWNELERQNEVSVMIGLMPMLAKDSRTLNELDEEVTRGFDADFLAKIFDTEFRRGCVPIPDQSADNLLIGNILAKAPGIKNPKPDIVYGLSMRALTPQQKAIALKFEDFIRISPAIVCPFMIFEWKNAKNSLIEARDQACRGGAALVNAMVKLTSLAGCQYSGDKPDASTMVFSCAISAELAKIHVHFRQLSTEGKVEWYMATVSKYVLEDDDDVVRLRRDIHNILDWGVLKRAKEIKDLLDEAAKKIYTGEASSPPPKKRKI